MGRLLAIIRKEFIHLRRDTLALTLALFIPVAMLFIFGYAINTEVKHIPTVVWDQSGDVEAARLLEAFGNSQYFDLRFRAGSFAEVRRYVDRGQAKVGIVIPPDFAHRLASRQGPTIQVIVDASDPLVATSAVNAASALGQARSLQILTETVGGSAIRADPPLDVRIRAWYNPDLESALFIVPGLVGALLMQTTVTIMSAAIVRERERGTLEALVVSPIRRWELMLGKIVPNLLVAYGQMTLALGVAHFVFDVPIRGSVPLLYLLSLVFMMGTLGVGIFISTLARTIPQALQMSFMTILPSVYLSGLLFPLEGMPEPAQWLAGLLPLTYYLKIIRGIILKGIGVGDLWTEILALVLFGAAIFTLSVLRFHKSVE